ncbi:MAG: SAF domain-containing protein [Streptosporangiales bacterium]
MGLTDTNRAWAAPTSMPGSNAGVATRVRGPRWRDPRLLVGVLLVLVSVVVGARLFASGDDTTRVWVAARDLDVGRVLAADDLERANVRLLDTAARYVSGSSQPVGYVLTRAVGAGELLPKAALVAPGKAAERRMVTVPVHRGHLPPNLRGGERVDVFGTPSPKGTHAAEPRLVVSGAVVSNVDQRGSGLGAGGSEVGVVLAVVPEAVPELIGAIHAGDVDLVRVPLGAEAAATPSASP